ncbi:MAG: rRNA maturation RNase YbeY [Pseudomonadota bacterium]
MIATTERHPLVVDIQIAVAKNIEIPAEQELIKWANAAYLGAVQKVDAAEVTIRFVDVTEITELNSRYRNQAKATNVLSFPVDDLATELLMDPTVTFDEEWPNRLLGDLIICSEVVISEAKNAQKSVMSHYAHMVTHGILHLCGYDHVDEFEAEQMEALEVDILATQGIANPY